MNIWTARGDTAFSPRLRMSMYARMTSSALPKPGADRHREASRVDVGRPAIGPRPPTQHQGHLLRIGQPTQLHPAQFVVEVFEQLTPDPHREVQFLDERGGQRADAAAAFEQSRPGGLCFRGQRVGRRDAGDDYVREFLHQITCSMGGTWDRADQRLIQNTE